jgi:hypothetical protein
VETIDTKPIIGSHTPTDFGKYDTEPFPVEGNAYYWYQRAVYWKREAHRKEGVQQTMEFQEKSYAESIAGVTKITLSPYDLEVVKNHIKGGNKIAAIKHVREVTMAGLKEAKYYCDALAETIPVPPPTYPKSW